MVHVRFVWLVEHIYGVGLVCRPTVHLHPLCAENYDRLLLRSRPGVRLVIILVDEQSKSRLLQHYAAVILPYSRFHCWICSLVSCSTQVLTLTPVWTAVLFSAGLGLRLRLRLNGLGLRLDGSGIRRRLEGRGLGTLTWTSINKPC